jgi:ABC-type multidrug transport system fused ATPase/permease subunit
MCNGLQAPRRPHQRITRIRADPSRSSPPPKTLDLDASNTLMRKPDQDMSARARKRDPSHDVDDTVETGFGEESNAPGVTSYPPLPPLWVGRRRWTLAGLAASSLAQAALVVAAALFGRALVDREAALTGIQALGIFVTLLLIVALLQRWQIVQAERLAQTYIAEIRLALFDTLATLSPMGRLKRSRGGVMLRFVGDAQALRAWIGFGIPTLVSAGIAWVALVAGLAALDITLAAVALVVGSLAALGMLWTLPPLAQAVRQARLRQAYIAANVHDKLAALPVMQSAAQQRRERRRLERQNQRLTDAMTLRAAAQGRHHFVLDLALAVLALTVIGLLLFDPPGSHTLNLPGSTGQVVGALGLIGLLSAPLRQIGRALEQRTAAQVARERIAEFLADAEPRGPSAAEDPRPADGSVQIAGWALPSQAGPTFAGNATAGRRIAVLGSPGSGQTALLETLARLRPVSSGGVWLGGVPIEHLSERRFARAVSFIAPEMPLLRGTVGRNLRYRRPSASLEMLRAACDAAGWPHGLDQDTLDRRVQDAGANLTGQDRRALAIARALVGAPLLLLVDDIEYCLTAPSTQALQRLLAAHRGTLIFSTHDRVLAATADEIWNLGDPVVPGDDDAPPLRLVSAKGP